MSSPPPPHNRRGFKVAVICALPLEAENVQYMFDRCWEDEDIRYGKAEGDQNAYSTGMIGRHNVVLAHMPSMGNNSASAVAAGLRSSFPEIKLVLVVGICGVVPIHATTQQEIILGDVIISTAVIQYDFGRQYPESFYRKKQIEDSLGRASPEIRSFISMLKTRQIHKRLTKNLALLINSKDFQKEVPTAKYPGANRDQLYESSYLHQHRTDSACELCNNNLVTCPLTCAVLKCEEGMLISRNRLNVLDAQSIDHVPSIHFGRFGSANMVMKSGVDRDRIATADELIAFEMESAGVWDQYPTVVIKAACDYADSHKNKAWQDYAAATAAACLKAFLVEWVIPDQLPDRDSSYDDHRDRHPPLPIGAGLESGPNTRKTTQLSDLSEAEKACLQAFSSDYETIRQKIGVNHPGTCEWVLCHPDFNHWKKHQVATGPLWISGNAGMGKSVLSKFLLQSFESQSSDNKVVYYFCDAQDENHRTAESLLRALIHQYIRFFPFLLRKHVLTLHEAHGKTIYTSFAILWQILTSVWAESGLGQLYCVLDALDECEEKSRDKLLTQIGSTFSMDQQGQNELITANGVRLIITSRPYESIRARLFPFAIIRLRAESEELQINRDIARYVDAEVPKLAALRRYDDSLQECVHSALVTGGDGMFLWVSLMIAVLERTPTKLVRDRIKRMPRGIESVYDRVLEEIPDESRETAFNLLMWVAFARRPLRLDELGVACAVNCESELSVRTHDTESYSRDDILGDIQLCGPILKVQPDESVHLVHQTTKEYLIQLASPTRIQRLFVEERNAHSKIALVCLTYLASRPDDDLRFFLDSVGPWFTWSRRIGNPWDRLQKELPLLRYATSFWQDHVRQSVFEDRKVEQTLEIALADDSFARKFPILQIRGVHQRTRRPFSIYTPLHILVHNDLEAEAIRYIDSRSFSVNSQSAYGNGISVLHLAAERGYHTIVTKLLSRDADVQTFQEVDYDARSFRTTRNSPRATRKSTALHLAVRNRHTEAARLLLVHGASPDAVEEEDEFHEINSTGGITCRNKRTALQIAVQNNQIAMTRLLLEHGADTEAIEEHFARQARLYGSACSHTERRTVLHAAIAQGYQDTVALLLEKGAKTVYNEAGLLGGYYENTENGSTFSLSHFGMTPRWATKQHLSENGKIVPGVTDDVGGETADDE